MMEPSAYLLRSGLLFGGGGERRARAWDFAPRGRPPRGSPVPETGRVPRTRGGGGFLPRVAPVGPRTGRAPGPRPALRPGPLPGGYGGGGRRRRGLPARTPLVPGAPWGHPGRVSPPS